MRHIDQRLSSLTCFDRVVLDCRSRCLGSLERLSCGLTTRGCAARTIVDEVHGATGTSTSLNKNEKKVACVRVQYAMPRGRLRAVHAVANLLGSNRQTDRFKIRTDPATNTTYLSRGSTLASHCARSDLCVCRGSMGRLGTSHSPSACGSHPPRGQQGVSLFWVAFLSGLSTH